MDGSSPLTAFAFLSASSTAFGSVSFDSVRSFPTCPIIAKSAYELLAQGFVEESAEFTCRCETAQFCTVVTNALGRGLVSQVKMVAFCYYNQFRLVVILERFRDCLEVLGLRRVGCHY